MLIKTWMSLFTGNSSFRDYPSSTAWKSKLDGFMVGRSVGISASPGTSIVAFT